MLIRLIFTALFFEFIGWSAHAASDYSLPTELNPLSEEASSSPSTMPPGSESKILAAERSAAVECSARGESFDASFEAYPSGKFRTMACAYSRGNIVFYRTWNADGTYRNEGLLEDGKPVCDWKVWDAQGKMSVVHEGTSASCQPGSQGAAPPTVIAQSTSSPGESVVSKPSRFHLLNFRLFGYGVVQPTLGGNCITGGINWTPAFDISSHFSIVGKVDSTLLLENGSNALFPTVGYELFLSYRITDHWQFEAGGGGQSWIVTGGQTAPTASGNIVYEFNHPFLRIIDLVFAGYSALFQSAAIGHQMSAGIGLRI